MAPADEGALEMVLSKYNSPEKEAALSLSNARDPAKMPKTGPTAKIGALCTADNCSRLAVLRWPGEEKDSRCTHHGEKGMLSRTFLCARDDLQCFKHARYGWPGQSVTHCEVHKEEGMVANDRESKRFTKPTEQAEPVPPDEERCTFYSRDFGIGQQRRCKRPRKEGYKQCEHHVELRRRRAQKAKEGTVAAPTIEVPPVPDEQRCTYWAQHPLRGRVQCKRERMPEGILCEMHSKNADRRKMCWVEGCQRTGSNGIFGFSLRLACSWHTACGMIGKKDTYDRCFKLGCAARATMGPEGAVMPMLCKEHADPGMSVLHPEGNNMAAPKVLNQPKKEELEALKEWDLVEEWVAKYKASPITDAEQYRQDAYQLITRQRAEKMETFVRVKKPAPTPKPRRTKEEMEAAAEERKRLAAEKDGWKAELAEKRQQVQLAREQKEAEKKRVAAEKAAQRAQAAAEKAAAKERAAEERAANGTGPRQRKVGEPGVVPKKRAKQMMEGGPQHMIVDMDPSLVEQALPVAVLLQDGVEGDDGAPGTSGAGPQETGEPSSSRGDVLGGFVYGGPSAGPAVGAGIVVRPLALQLPVANGVAATAERPPELRPDGTTEPEIYLIENGQGPMPMDVTDAVAAPGGSAPSISSSLPAGSTGAPNPTPAAQRSPQLPPQAVVLGKVYQGVPVEDVYDWLMAAERRDNGSAGCIYSCTFPGCPATKLMINDEGAAANVIYEVAHLHAPGEKAPPGAPPLSIGSTPLSDQRPGPPARRSHLGAPIQVAVPAALYMQQQMQAARAQTSNAGRPMFRPILPKPAPKPKQPKKKGAGKQDMDVLFVEECARVFKPAGEAGLSRDEVKSFLSKWSKFPLDTEEGQVKLQQALECGLFEEVAGGRYKLREAQAGAPPAAKQVASQNPEEGPGRMQAAHSEHAAAMLKYMGGSAGTQTATPMEKSNGDVAAPQEPGPVSVAEGGVEAVSEPDTRPRESLPVGVPTKNSLPAPATTSIQIPEEPAVLALGAPNPQLGFPALSPPISELLLGEDERAARDSLPLSEEEEAMLRKLTVRKLQARRSMVPAWLRESVTAGAKRLAWLQARKDRMQGEKRAEAEQGGGQEERREELGEAPEVEQPTETMRALELVQSVEAGPPDQEGQASEVGPLVEVGQTTQAGEKPGERPGESNPAGTANLDIGDILDFPAVEDLPGDQNWLTSPTAGFLGFAPESPEQDREQAQAEESAQEGVRARIPQRKAPEGVPEAGAAPSETEKAAPESLEQAPESENSGKEGLTVHQETVRQEQKEMMGAPKKRKRPCKSFWSAGSHLRNQPQAPRMSFPLNNVINFMTYGGTKELLPRNACGKSTSRS
ncbi:hypothetical protein KFL_004820020 [Klebsormidium nitens]|uniref:WRC domain-containing protein n=1 Tax=Klebsormidium nitens TaxID=105231 RepID=A0A1Y1IG55_KLENI|nr:hypothetical protein KFL_004820020 [Klebsormidium nitens]|eukprot:GAQ89042.1 hypothetical protein KFL_004820020 [Klebsormidium nitens]